MVYTHCLYIRLSTRKWLMEDVQFTLSATQPIVQNSILIEGKQDAVQFSYPLQLRT